MDESRGTKRDANSPIENDSKKMSKETSTSPLSTVKRELECVKEEMNEGIGSLTTKLGNVFYSQSQTTEALNFHGQHIASINKELAALKLEVREKDLVINKLSRGWNDEIRKLKKDVDENTKDRRNKNMVINGLPESPNENCLGVVLEFLKKMAPNISSKDIASAYRLGKKISGDMNRPTMVRFKDPQIKMDVMRKKSSLKNSDSNKGIFCNDDLPEEQRRVRQKLREISRFASKNGYDDVQVKGDRLWIGGKMFSGDELHLLPLDLQPENISTRPAGNGLGFSGESSYLSNFFPCCVRMGDKSFCSAEQAYQFNKCLFCNREDAGLELMKIGDPSVIKYMGGKIFTTHDWEMKKKDMMKCILLSKYEQNPELKMKLKATGSTPLYECTQSRFWGTGWLIDSPNWNKSSSFPGNNLLGKLLMEIRDDVGGANVTPDDTNVDKGQMDDNDSGEKDKETDMDIGITASTGINPQIDHGKENFSGIDQSPRLYDMICDAVGTKENENHVGKSDGAISTDTAIEGTSEKSSSTSLRAAQSQCSTKMNTTGMEVAGHRVDDTGMLSHDSISFNSSTYLSENTSFTRKSVSRLDGGLDVNKLMNWTLPILDTSLTGLSKGGHKRHPFNPSEEASAVSTPILIAENLNKFKKKKKSTIVEHGSGDNKAAMIAVMNKMLKK